MVHQLAGARVLVTGASGGIGAALARGFAVAGSRVAICARRRERLDEVLDSLPGGRERHRAFTVDLADLDATERLAADVDEAFGGLDVLVNNAGMPKRRWAWDHRPDEIAAVLRINVESPIRLTTALLPSLTADGGGTVVFVGSVAARLAPPSEAVYAASKAAVTAYAEGLRVDLGVAGRPVDVHVVQPGVIDTDLFSLPDNDPSLADVEPLPADALVEPVLGLVADGGPMETFVPAWFADLPSVKVADTDGFLQGAVEYTLGRLRDLDIEPPS